MIQTCHVVASLPLNSSPLPPLLFLAIIIIIIIPARPSPLLAFLISPSLSSKHPLWITSIPHRDILTLSMVSRHSAKMFPLTLYSNEREREMLEGTSTRINAQISTISPQPHTCQTQCCGEITQHCFFFFVFLPPACQGWDAWWKKTQSLQSGPVAGASAFSLGAAGIRRDRGRWWAPKAASFAWHALYNERRNLSKCHSSTKCLALIPTKCCRVPPCLLWQSLQLY